MSWINWIAEKSELSSSRNGRQASQVESKVKEISLLARKKNFKFHGLTWLSTRCWKNQFIYCKIFNIILVTVQVGILRCEVPYRCMYNVHCTRSYTYSLEWKFEGLPNNCAITACHGIPICVLGDVYNVIVISFTNQIAFIGFLINVASVIVLLFNGARQVDDFYLINDFFFFVYTTPCARAGALGAGRRYKNTRNSSSAFYWKLLLIMGRRAVPRPASYHLLTHARSSIMASKGRLMETLHAVHW